jgi:hypothetical protein
MITNRPIGDLNHSDLGTFGSMHGHVGRIDRVEHVRTEPGPTGETLTRVDLWLGEDYWSSGRIDPDHELAQTQPDDPHTAPVAITRQPADTTPPAVLLTAQGDAGGFSVALTVAELVHLSADTYAASEWLRDQPVGGVS